MRLRSLFLAFFLLPACSGGTDVDVTGLWETQVGASTICRVFCADGLTLETLGDDPTCNEWYRPDGHLSCFPYGVDGDELSIGGDSLGQVSLSTDAEQLTWTSGTTSTSVYTRLADTAAVCSQPCYGPDDQQLRQ
jgi:hypothetical protein